MNEADFIAPLGLMSVLAGLTGLNKKDQRTNSALEKLRNAEEEAQAVAEAKETADKEAVPTEEELDKIVYDEKGDEVGTKGDGGIFDFSGYHDPIHNFITSGDDPESFSNNLSDFLIGTEKPVYDEKGNLVSGDPNENFFNTAGVGAYAPLPLLPFMGMGPVGVAAALAGAGYQAASSFAPELTQKYIDAPVGKAYDYSKELLGKAGTGIADAYNDFMQYEGYNMGGQVQHSQLPPLRGPMANGVGTLFKAK